MSNSKYATRDTMKPLISICSSANVINVQGFIDELSVRFPNFNVQYFELPYNDIDHFRFKGEDVGIMILCHSINNRRFAISDVMDALYDRFLPNSAYILGKERICVVAHDFPASKGLGDPDKYKDEMKTFEYRQSTAFKTSSLVMMAGKLEGPVELQESNWQQLEEFLERAVRSPMPKPGHCERIMETLYMLYGPTRYPVPKSKGWWQLIGEKMYKHPRIIIPLVASTIGLGGLMFSMLVRMVSSYVAHIANFPALFPDFEYTESIL